MKRPNWFIPQVDLGHLLAVLTLVGTLLVIWKDNAVSHKEFEVRLAQEERRISKLEETLDRISRNEVALTALVKKYDARFNHNGETTK